MAEFEKSLERYDVLDRIAVGGMAEVFLAKAYGAHGFEKTLAIKRILPDLARDPEFEERFIAEAKVAVRLAHANVVQVLDFGRFAGSLFIAMEYVDGLDLAALLRRFRDEGRKVPLPAAFHIAIEIARGLDFAHQHGVVHRDVSPSNILLSRAGEVKIADFGIAIAARPHRTRPGAGPRRVMGKWRYMSPEQARGEVLDTRSDLFSAAAVMFELFTGEKLFPGEEAEDILRNIEDMPIPSLASVRADLPPRLDDILGGALARRPDDRPVRAATVLRALTELSYESSIVATSLDVAEAVAAVAGPSVAGRSPLDDIIRKQLIGSGQGPGPSEHGITEEKRKTAVATSPGAAADATGVFLHKVGGDGLSRLEIEETTLAAQPRSRRTTGSEGALGGAGTGPEHVIRAATDEGSRAARGTAPPSIVVSKVELPESLDPDRRTQVGPPLDESRPIVKVSLDDDEVPRGPGTSRSPTGGAPVAIADPAVTAPMRAAPTSVRRIPGALIAAVVGVAVVLAVLVVLIASRGGGATTAAVLPDAGLAARTGTLEIETVPPGAHGSAGDLEFATTPVSLSVPAATPLKLTLSLARFQPYVDDRVVVGAGQVVRIRATLLAAKAILRITTTPPGATVTLGGRVLGETPLERADLEPAAGVSVEIARAGFVPITTRVDLIAGEIAEVERDLKAAPKVGAIDLQIDGGWAEIYLRGKKVGRAPIKGLKLPVGRHQLRLYNPLSKVEKMLAVEVDEHEVRYYRTPL